ncbi:MAG: T9SS type A sorting domain-containing protein [Paludibacter sp.]|nr:T9SS type A sorting domain-containing protein [Paludibacter sp.]
MKKLFITLIVSVLAVFGLNSQNIANYHFSTAQNAVLEDITGSTQLIPGSARNMASTVTGIGFTFKFMAVDYTQFSVNSNGQFCFGSTVIPGTGIDNPIAGMPLLVPISGADSILGSGKVHYIVKGTAPNRILVVEWKDIIIPFPLNDNNPPIAEFNLTQLQVILHETTGLIEFKYGVVNNNSVPNILKSIFISSSNTATTVKSIGADLISAVNGVPVQTFQMNSTNENLLNGRVYSFNPIPNAPTITVVDSCTAASSLTASNYTGTLLWSTSETTPTIVVYTPGYYLVTQTVDGYTSLPDSAFAAPVPTITGPMVNGLPATLDGNPILGQVYTTEPGKTNYVWAVSSGATHITGLGTNSITVDWGTLSSQQSVSVSYQNALLCTKQTVLIINYYPYAASIDPTTVPQFVDPMPHFAAGLRVDVKAGGALVVKEVLVQQVALSTGTVVSTGTIGTTPGAGLGNYAAYAISKDNGATFGPAMWPAQTIEAQQGNQLTVQYQNKLNGVRYDAFNILADQTLMMNGYDLNGNILTDPYRGDIPMVVHLHGGEIPSGSDGGPTAWFTPDYAKFGPGFAHSAQSLVTYPNKQEATTLWYHPHDQGLTRINVYTGLAGYYFLRGAAEEAAHLPGWSGDTKVQEVTPAGKTPTFNGTKTYLPEIELAVQDRMFNTKGELYWPVNPTNPDIHPFWTPEFFGNIMTVNGKSWPYLSVAPRKYRFRVLDGCNARFLNMWLMDLANSVNGPKITVVGTDGGLLDAPVVLDPANGGTAFMAPGERMDVVIDFTGMAGKTFTLMNDAAAPYPTGDPVIPGLTDRIMQFVVNGNVVDANNVVDPTYTDNSLLNPNLRPLNPMVKLTDFAGNLATNVVPNVKRQIILNEVTGPGGPVQVLFNNSHFDAATPLPGAPAEFGGPTEMPLEGTTELFQIINTTVDAHPIHIHLLQWQLVSRQAFTTSTYMTAYGNAWATKHPTVPIWPAGLGYPGGAGSPYRYDSINADGAVGGNPAITPFLTGPVMPARPEEMGWKDDIKAIPGEVATFIVRVAPTDKPIGATQQDLLLPFDPSIGPGYVWHCHIIDHEDMDMMRPLMIKPSLLRYPQITAQPAPVVSCIGNSETFAVTATSATTITYQWQISTDNGVNWLNLTNGAPYSGVLTNALTINPIAIAMSTNRYRVILTNIDGVTTSNGALLTVDPDVPASVSITVNENPIFNGETVTFTPAPVGGGTAPTYQWYKNAVMVSTGNTYTYAPANGDMVYVIMTSSAHCATGSPATSNTITMSVTGSSTVAQSGDWSVPATWANNTVPTSSDNVVIPLGFTVTINQANAFCYNLVVEGALSSTIGSQTLTVGADLLLEGTMTITGANTVVLKGATSGSANIDVIDGNLVYAGLLPQTISNIASNAIKNLTSDNKAGVTLPAILTVSNLLTINAGAKLTNPALASQTVNNVMIKSDVTSGTGTFVDNGLITTTPGGVANVQQYVTGGRNWYISSPVTNATTGSISTASLVQSYNESTSLWVPESSTLNVLKGYVASISTTGVITFTGAALNTGSMNPGLTRVGSTIKTGYNLVGNPYPSYLNWDLASAASSNLETTIWYRTKNAANTVYVFDTYNATGGIGTSNNGTVITSMIPPIQAFWVRVASGVSGTLAVTNAMRSHEGVVSNRLKARSFEELSQQVLRLQVTNGTNSDEAIVLFNANAVDGMDKYDSEKMTNGNAYVPEIYTLAGTEPVVINGLNSVKTTPELSLGFNTGEVNIFTIKAIEASNFDADTRIVLKDKQLNVEKELKVGDDYSFSSNATNTSTRFSILFKSASITTGKINTEGNGSESMFIYRNQNNRITINRSDAIGEGTVTVCNAIGQKLVNMSTTGTLTVVNQRLLPGVYLVTVDVQGKSTTKKITLY